MQEYPIIHLNGSGAASLIAQYEEASRACNVAIEAVCNAAPNARDYYLKGDQSYQEARRQHVYRLERLQAVRSELVEILGDLLDQQDLRVRSKL